MECIRIENLTKKFGNLEVFKNINFKIEENTIVGISGKNGCGKTTLLKLISGLLLPDNGKIFVYKKDIFKERHIVKNYIGLSLNTDNGFYPQLTVLENLKFLCLLYKKTIEDFKSYIEELELYNFLNTKFLFCSSGTKTKLWLLSSLIKNSKILLIDELTKSIDFDTKQKVYNFIKNLNQKYQVTVIFVSHSIEEITTLSNKWLHIENGEIIERI
ncbi:MAG: ATP-binding cassette domain-containing protein [Endomicrobiia bacterium]